MKESVDTYWHTSTDFQLHFRLSLVKLDSDEFRFACKWSYSAIGITFPLDYCKTHDLGDNLVRKIYTGVNMTGGYGGYYCTHFTPHYI